MSHFAKMEVNFLQKNETDLIASLKSIYGEDGVEVYDEAHDLSLYSGQNATDNQYNHAPPCHIIVRRKTIEKQLGRTCLTNDMGFRRNDDGGYEVHLDLAGVSKAQMGKLAQEYTLKVSERQLKKQGYQTKRVPDKNGVVKLIGSKYS